MMTQTDRLEFKQRKTFGDRCIEQFVIPAKTGIHLNT